MENLDPKNTESDTNTKPIEQDYESHKENPGFAEPAVTEKDENGAGLAMKWIIPVILIGLFILWFVFRK